MDDKREKAKELVRMANLSSIGIALILCTLIGYGMGYFIDKHFHTKPFCTIIFLILGICAGFLNAYRTITKDSD